MRGEQREEQSRLAEDPGSLQRRVAELVHPVAALRCVQAPRISAELSQESAIVLHAPASPRPPLLEALLERVPKASLEHRLGTQVFSLIGIPAIIVGTSWALELAFERGLIGPFGRVLIGLAAGVGLVLPQEPAEGVRETSAVESTAEHP